MTSAQYQSMASEPLVLATLAKPSLQRYSLGVHRFMPALAHPHLSGYRCAAAANSAAEFGDSRTIDAQLHSLAL